MCKLIQATGYAYSLVMLLVLYHIGSNILVNEHDIITISIILVTYEITILV